jgi:hypothetical protein
MEGRKGPFKMLLAFKRWLPFCGLVVTSALTPKMASTQDKTNAYVQVTRITFSPEQLHLHAKDSQCGTASVTIFAFKSGAPDPTVRVELDQYSSQPFGVLVDISPGIQSGTIAAPSNHSIFSFKVCAAGRVTGTATVLATVASVRSESRYEIREPVPVETARDTFQVAP